MILDYPIKFISILQERIWGGDKLHRILGKNLKDIPIGESWEISAVPDNVSVVANGNLRGENLQDLINDYKTDFVGTKVFEKFGTDFPLLIKFIDAKSDLSIQLHPNDQLAKKRHHSFGKEEMWYIMQAEKDAHLFFGFNQELSKKSYLKHLDNNTLPKVLHQEKVKEGDVYYIPAGRVHAIGGGIILAEIQQSSDITYRLYDWDRKDINGNKRKLHTALALDAIDFSMSKDYKTQYNAELNKISPVINSPYFTTNILTLSDNMSINRSDKDSFTIYMCVEGSGNFITNNISTPITIGESILIPAILQDYEIIPNKKILKLLQITA
jgi:mannose-6-phosphate isomerase